MFHIHLTTSCKAMLVIVLSSTAAMADIPRQIHYQGKLRDSAGVAVAGTVSLRFRLYDLPTDPSTVLFDELHGSVGMSQGLFSVVIGSVAPGGLPDSVWSAAEVWLGVTPQGGAEMGPRTRIGAAPYALQSAALDQRKWQTGNPATGIKDYIDNLKVGADSVLSTVPGGNFDATNLTPGNLKQGIQAGAPSAPVIGDYPSATYPLPDAGAGGVTTDLSQGDPPNGSYEWWMSGGTRVTGSFDYPATSSVLDTDTVRGVAGTIQSQPNVSGANGSKTFGIPDGYYSGRTATANDSNLSSSNIRNGVTILGVTGNVAAEDGYHCSGVWRNYSAPSCANTCSSFGGTINADGGPVCQPVYGGFSPVGFESGGECYYAQTSSTRTTVRNCLCCR